MPVRVSLAPRRKSLIDHKDVACPFEATEVDAPFPSTLGGENFSVFATMTTGGAPAARQATNQFLGEVWVKERG